jgi:hypothetical protein
MDMEVVDRLGDRRQWHRDGIGPVPFQAPLLPSNLPG